VDSLWSLQVIEALHRKQNSVKNLTSNISNKEAQMAAVLDNEFHRGICADVVCESNGKEAEDCKLRMPWDSTCAKYQPLQHA
jgi:hypothetical protein